MIFITHDRYFLDVIATRILEMFDGRCYSHAGNYTADLESKAIRMQIAEQNERRRQRFLRVGAGMGALGRQGPHDETQAPHGQLLRHRGPGGAAGGTRDGHPHSARPDMGNTEWTFREPGRVGESDQGALARSAF